MAEAWPTDPGEGPLCGAGSCMRSREGGAPTACAAKSIPSKPFAAAPDGKPGQTAAAFEPCGVFRPHAGRLGLAGFSHVGMAGLEPAASRPPAARAANCATFRNRRHPPPEPKPRWAKKEDGGVARRPGLEPRSTVLETAVLAIAPPTQREASMTPRAWPPGPPNDQASRTPPESPEPDSNRRPAAYEAAALPLGHRGLDGPSHRFPMHDESLFARVPCQARHGRNRLVEPAGFGPATFPLRTGCAASAPRPHAGPHLCGEGRPEKESFGWRRYAAGALGRIRTGDAHLRRVALYPLSYGGRRRPA